MSINTLYSYEKLANFITKLIDDGVFLRGSRIPSLREICKQHNVSVSTATQAYHLLEDRGILEAREKSGFYVANRKSATLEIPQPAKPINTATLVSNSDIFLEMLERAADLNFAPLGCAIPSAELLAASKLDKSLARTARMSGTNNNIYTVPKGDLGLRKQIARRALQWGQNIASEDIIITCGCTEALSIALKTLTKEGDTIAVESPTYLGHLQLIKTLNLKVLEIPTNTINGINIDILQNALSQNAINVCLFSSSFSNPLGSTMTDEKKSQILNMLTKHNIPLIEDDIMGDIYFSQNRPKPFMSLGDNSNIIYCSSFSKTIAPGYRVGWVVAKNHMPQLLQNKLATSLASPTLTQVAIADYLSNSGYDSHLRRIRRLFANNLDRTTRAVEKYFPIGTRVSRPTGGFLLWLELPNQIDGAALFKQALTEDICFAPGMVFSANGQYSNYMRLSCGHEWNDKIETALKTLGEMANQALKSYSKHHLSSILESQIH